MISVRFQYLFVQIFEKLSSSYNVWRHVDSVIGM